VGGQRGRADHERELRVEQLTLGEGPVPRVLEQARALDQEGADPLMQPRRGPGHGGGMGRGEGSRAGQEKAGSQDKASFGRSRAHDQTETGRLGSSCCGAEVLKGRPDGGHTRGLAEEGRCEMWGELERTGCRVSAGRGSQGGHNRVCMGERPGCGPGCGWRGRGLGGAGNGGAGPKRVGKGGGVWGCRASAGAGRRVGRMIG
jgi:hypothetical protein